MSVCRALVYNFGCIGGPGAPGGGLLQGYTVTLLHKPLHYKHAALRRYILNKRTACA